MVLFDEPVEISVTDPAVLVPASMSPAMTVRSAL